MDGDEFQNFKTCILGEIFQVELVEVEEKAEGRVNYHPLITSTLMIEMTSTMLKTLL